MDADAEAVQGGQEMSGNTDDALSKEQMHKVGRLNPYLRDRCGVPFRDSFRLAMLIVSNWDGIKDLVEGQEDKE